jgi:hypothetical protein
MGIARRWRDQDEWNQAHELLARHGWFSEGFDTRALRGQRCCSHPRHIGRGDASMMLCLMVELAGSRAQALPKRAHGTSAAAVEEQG